MSCQSNRTRVIFSMSKQLVSSVCYYLFLFRVVHATLDHGKNTLVRQREDELANAALIRSGLLGCSPVQPVVAIKLECLELYHQVRRRQSSFSIQAMVKVICALQNVCAL